MARPRDRARRQAFWRRVQLRLDVLGLSRNGFGKAVGASSGTVSGWFTDAKMPRTAAMLGFPDVLRCSGHWLLTGEGPEGLPRRRGDV